MIAEIKTQNPFPGLRPFDEEDAGVFFGRDQHIDELLRRLRIQRFLGVVGTSGAGKSSLVRAGLVPALVEGFLTDAGSEWRIAIFRPGEDPLDALADELAKPDVLGASPQLAETLEVSSQGLVEAALRSGLREAENLLVVVDQFEELFRYPHEKTERAAALVERLLVASKSSRASIYVILTMRSDYLGECAQFAGLAEELNGGQYLIPRLSVDQRREAIEGPVLVGGATVTRALVEQLLSDSSNESDQLPLLQHTLNRIWEVWSDEPSGTPIDLKHYRNERIKDLHQALDISASAVLAELKGDDSQRVSRLLFRRITDRGSGKRDTRRPTKVREIMELTGAPLDQIEAVVSHFSRPGVSFLHSSPSGELTEESIVDISHETLIANWNTLRKWAEQEADFSRDYRRLAEAAHARDNFFVKTTRLYFYWQANLLADLLGNFPGGNFPNDELRRRRTFRTELQRMFIVAPFMWDVLRAMKNPQDGPLGIWAKRYSDENTFRRAISHLYGQYKYVLLRLSLYYVLGFALFFLAVFWFDQYRTASRQQVNLEAEREVVQANESFANGDVGAALASAVKAFDVTQSAEEPAASGALEVLKRATAETPSIVLEGHSKEVSYLQWSPDGQLLASSSEDGKIGLWSRLQTKAVAVAEVQKQGAPSIAWNPDGKRLAIAGRASIEFWGVSPLGRGTTLANNPSSLPTPNLAWSPDGSLLVTAAGFVTSASVWRGTKFVHNLSALNGYTDSIQALAWRPAEMLAQAGQSLNSQSITEIWDPKNNKKLGDVPDVRSDYYAVGLAWNDDGNLLAISDSYRSSVRVYDIERSPRFSSKTLGEVLGGSRGFSIKSIAWGHKGSAVDRRGLMAVSTDTVRIFRISPTRTVHEQIAELGRSTGIVSLDWSPDGLHLAAGDSNGKIYIYDLDFLDAQSIQDWLKLARARLEARGNK